VLFISTLNRFIQIVFKQHVVNRNVKPIVKIAIREVFSGLVVKTLMEILAVLMEFSTFPQIVTHRSVEVLSDHGSQPKQIKSIHFILSMF
jgi:hypothetical protein